MASLERARRIFRRAENFVLRSILGQTNPIVLKDVFGIRFLLYPEDNNPIRWQVQAGTNIREFRVIEKFIKEGDIAFDVGANIGLITSFLAKKVGPRGAVYSFEPHPTTFLELKKTVSLNELTNVHLEQAAVSSSAGKADLHFVRNSKLSSLSPIQDTHYGEDKTVAVETVTIDAYCALRRIDHIDIMKIDVEGNEFNVLSGAEGMLSRHKIKAIQFEMRDRSEEILAFLEKNGYVIKPEYTNSYNYYAFLRDSK